MWTLPNLVAMQLVAIKEMKVIKVVVKPITGSVVLFLLDFGVGQV